MTGRDLESRYRRLLAVYPWEHRRRYADEMLAVLLAGARPGQRRPGPGETLNLVGAGLRVRLGLTVRGLADPAWIDGAALTGLLGALALLALGADALAQHTPRLHDWPGAPEPGALDWLRVSGWALLCAAVLAGLRRSAVALAWAGVIAEIAVLSPRYGDNPVPVVANAWQVLLALIVAGALTVPAPRRRALALLGVRRLVAIVAALAAIEGIFLVSRLTDPSYSLEGSGTVYVLRMPAIQQSTGTHDLVSGIDLVVYLYLAGLVAAGLTIMIALATVAAPIRRRLLVLLAPIAALIALVDLTMSGWATSNNYLDHAIYLVPVQWTALVGVPLATFALGVVAIQRREQTLRMVALGRAADSEADPTAGA